MARVVMVEFQDNKEAERFVERLTQDQLKGKGRRAIGLIPTPTQFCECDPATRKCGRTTKFGWWVCLECKKAQPGWQSPVNLLQPNLVSVKEQSMWMHLIAGRPLTERDAHEGDMSFYAFPDHLLGDQFPVTKPRNASRY